MGTRAPAQGRPFTVDRSPFALFARWSPLTLLLLLACGGLSPLRGHAVVGRDAYLVFVADGAGGQPDLFAVRADGGPVIPLTYTNVAEAAPALSPDGGTVAFLRGRSASDPHPGAVWVLNLLSGADRELALPRRSPPADRVGWSADGRFVYARAGRVTYRLVPPPGRSDGARAVNGPEWFAAESSFAVVLGNPPFGRVVNCGGELCVESRGGDTAPLAPGARAAVRWGGDSVAYLAGTELVVRPVGPGHARNVEWSGIPPHPREPTFFAGRR